MKQLPKNASDVMVRRYSLRDSSGRPIETPEEILRRTARVVAAAEYAYRDGVKPEEVEQKFVELLEDLRFIPNGRTLANAGTGGGQLANCFVLPLDDEMGRTEDGIFSILRKAVLVLQSGGGVGFSFGRIRPKGDSAGRGKATGAVSFLKVFDTAFWVIGQGGGRRSACMAVLPVSHPDIWDFIRCKRREGEIEHFNISVGITDEFMKAVSQDKPFNLVNPRNGKVWETIRARDLFNEIVKYAHHNGEPGVLFLDAANRDNPVPHQYNLEATNPCGEQFLGPYENCCMASVNLAEHVKKGGVDWQKLEETVEWTVRWLDDVVDANKYVPAVPDLEEAAHRNRRIGVSIMGLADLMYLTGVRYGSKEAVDLSGQLMEFIRYTAMKTSISLAHERGAFPGIRGSVYDFSKPYAFVAPKPIRAYKYSFGRPKLNWNGLMKNLQRDGIRNSCQTTIQPTGAIATISGLEGYGCEPVFALSYVMKTHEGAEENGDGNWAELYYESKLFATALKKAGLGKKDSKEVFEKVRHLGSCQKVAALPEEIRKVFVVSADVKVAEHVEMQAALQAFTDNAISKTVNFPAGSSEEDVSRAYLKGWRLGLKGMTVYVTGSRETVVLETQETRRARNGNLQKAKNGKKEPFVANGNGIVGKPLHKFRPEDMMCAECGNQMVLQEGCATCPACGSSKCAI